MRYSEIRMRTRLVYIETWGCQMNLHQSEGIAGILVEAGFSCTERLEDADVALFNGCMVRQKAEDKVYGRIGAVAELKRQHPIILGVGGCLGQVRADQLRKRFPTVDFVFGSDGHRMLPQLIEDAERGIAALPSTIDGTDVEETPLVRTSDSVAMVTITEGCSNCCSYCVVPYARGPMRSRRMERILEEVEAARGMGYHEVLLLGQNVNAYGIDHEASCDFPSLLAEVAEAGVARVRFTSSHPRDMTTRVWETMARYEALCPHVHLACQSGSDRILERMNRGYTRETFFRLVSEARAIVPGINVTTDIIVGYPGESERDFRHTMSLLADLRFGSVFVAKYSPRPHTASSKLEDDVSDREKQERLQRVLELQRRIARSENERLVGRRVDVLIEGLSRGDSPYGRAADHRTVVVSGAAAVGEIVSVEIESATSAALYGAARVPEKARNPR